jgi:hypothetical protein
MAAFGASFRAETMHKIGGEQTLSVYFSALGCALDEGRAAISVGRKAGNNEHNGNKLDLAIAYCRRREIRVGGNCCSAPQMSRSAAIHGTFGVIGRRGEGRL